MRRHRESPCRALPMAGLLLALAGTAAPAEDALRLNPFGDPFVQATGGRACPAPRGPGYTDAEIRQEAHHRAERGTSCWLAGQCSEPNAYRYDARLAREAAATLGADAALASSAIWLIAERRHLYLQGCVADAAQAARAAALAGAVADVQFVVPQLALPGEAPRYPLAAPGATGR